MIFAACLDMHAETKAELLALKSETQAEILALKSEVRQMKASMGSKFDSIEKALMHGKNKHGLLTTKPCSGCADIRVSFVLHVVASGAVGPYFSCSLC